MDNNSASLEQDLDQKLHRQFCRKSSQLSLQAIAWILGLAVSIWFLTDIANNLFQDLQGTASLKSLIPLSISNDIFVRLALLFPAIYAIYFSASEFRNSMKLKEAYDHKATIALALITFKEVVESTNGDPKNTQRFMIDTITNMIKNPTQEVFNVKDAGVIESRAKDMVTSIVETVGKVMPK